MFPIKLKSDTVAIIGGGPSLKDFDLSVIPDAWSKIAVNNSYKLTPDAEVLFFADARWYQQHYPAIHREWRGRMVSTAGDHQKVPSSEVYKLGREFNEPIGNAEGPYDPNTPKNWRLAGRDSGTMAVNLAYHLGARNIVLFGLDMTYEGKESHWHADHIWETNAVRYREMFAPVLMRLADTLTSRSIKLWRATEPGVPNIPYREVRSIES
jgi:hypothetical protein